MTGHGYPTRVQTVNKPQPPSTWPRSPLREFATLTFRQVIFLQRSQRGPRHFMALSQHRRLHVLLRGVREGLLGHPRLIKKEERRHVRSATSCGRYGCKYELHVSLFVHNPVNHIGSPGAGSFASQGPSALLSWIIHVRFLERPICQCGHGYHGTSVKHPSTTINGEILAFSVKMSAVDFK